MHDFVLPRHPATVDGQDLTTDIATRSTRQEHDRALEVLRLAPPASRYPRHDLLAPRLIVHQRRIHLCCNIPRRNAIHIDALPTPLVAKRLCELRNAAFTRRICRYCDSALEREQGSDVDDATSAAIRARLARKHVGADVAAECEDGVKVDLNDFVPVVVGELVGGVTTLDSAAVEKDSNIVAVCCHFRDERGHGGLGGEVCGVDLAFAAQFLDQLPCFLVRLVALGFTVSFCLSRCIGSLFVLPVLEGHLHLLRQEQRPWTGRFLGCRQYTGRSHRQERKAGELKSLWSIRYHVDFIAIEREIDLDCGLGILFVKEAPSM